MLDCFILDYFILEDQQSNFSKVSGSNNKETSVFVICIFFNSPQHYASISWISDYIISRDYNVFGREHWFNYEQVIFNFFSFVSHKFKSPLPLKYSKYSIAFGTLNIYKPILQIVTVSGNLIFGTS